MTKHDSSVQFLAKMIKKVDNLLLNDKERNNALQELLVDFINSYNDPTKLNKNSTPLSKLLHGLKKTDATLIKMYIESVTNAKIGLNDKNKLVIKLEKDSQLETNELFETLTWYDLAKDTKTIRKDHFDNIEQALKAYKRWFEKAIMTCESKEMVTELRKGVKQAETEIFEKLENKD